ncbi:MAG: adenosylcobinamide-GDP ribazoletransferase [Pseudomonadota bacterium]
MVEGLKLATQFLTRLPVTLDRTPPPLAQVAGWFPVVGAGLGLIAGLVFAGLTLAGLPTLAAACVVLALLALLTGALHEDGLADCADALGVRERGRRLEVMRDSRIGSFGAQALIFVTLARFIGLSSLWDPWQQLTTLVVAAALSRGAIVALWSFLPPARNDGLAAGRRPGPIAVALGLGLPAAAALVLLPPAVATSMLALTVATLIVWGAVAKRAFGGQTGDVLGAGQQLCEAVMLLSLTVHR